MVDHEAVFQGERLSAMTGRIAKSAEGFSLGIDYNHLFCCRNQVVIRANRQADIGTNLVVLEFIEQRTGAIPNAENLVVEVAAIDVSVGIRYKIENGIAFGFTASNPGKVLVVIVVNAFVGGDEIVVLLVLDHVIDLQSLEFILAKNEIRRLLGMQQICPHSR